MAEEKRGFINNYTSGIPASQRNAINALISERKRLGHIFTNTQLRTELTGRLRDLQDRGRAFSYSRIAPGTSISSDGINKIFEDIHLDLRILYDQIAFVSSDKARIGAITQDQFIKTKAAIVRLINDLRLFRFLKDNPDYQDAKYIDFNAARNETAYNPKAEVDVRTRALKLPLSQGQILAQSRFNLDKVSI